MSRRFQPDQPPRTVGRYALFYELASGGMATVHLGRLQASAGFSRTVAVKRLHEQHAKDPEFVAMLLDEARLAARIHHPNVVATLDVVVEDEELFLVMDYVHGETLARLIRNMAASGRMVPVPVAVSIIIGMLHGLHAAHEARSETGEPLDIVHRDMSPQNVIVGADGVARVLDFGVAKAANRAQTTQDGQLKGKLRYMSPEQLHSRPVTRSSDIFSAAIVAFELLTCQRFIAVDDPGAIIVKLLSDETPRPSTRRKELDWVADEVLIRGLKRDPRERYATALEFAVAFEKMGPASLAEVSAWVKEAAATDLALRASMLRETETRSPHSVPPPASPSVRPPEVEPVTTVASTSYAPGADSSSFVGVDHTRVLAQPSQPSHVSQAPQGSQGSQASQASQASQGSRPSQSPSQLSSITVTASVASPGAATPSRRRGALLGAMLAFFVVALALSVIVFRTRTKASATTVVATKATVAAPPPSPTPTPEPEPPPTAVPAAPVAISPAPALTPTPVPTDAAAATAAAAAPPRPPAARPPRRPTPPRPTPATPGEPDIILQR